MSHIDKLKFSGLTADSAFPFRWKRLNWSNNAFPVKKLLTFFTGIFTCHYSHVLSDEFSQVSDPVKVHVFTGWYESDGVNTSYYMVV